MKLKADLINSLPALPYGSFKIGCGIELDTQIDSSFIDSLGQMFQVKPEQLWLDPHTKHVPNPASIQWLINQWIFYMHNEQYKLAAGLPGQVFSLPQLPPNR